MGFGSVDEGYTGSTLNQRQGFSSIAADRGLREDVGFDRRCLVRTDDPKTGLNNSSGASAGLFRADLVSEIRKLIAQEAYGSNDQLSVAIDRMLSLV